MNPNQYQPPSIRGPAIRQATHFVPQQQAVSFDQLWKCSFCGSIHPTEQDRDIHMTDQCTASPMVARDDNTVNTPLRRPPMMKAHTIQTPSDPQFYPHADSTEIGPPIQGYAYHNQPNQPLFQIQPRSYQMRPNYPNYPTYPTGPVPYAGYHPDPQEQSVPYPQGVPYSQGVNRGRALPEPPLEGSGTKIPQNIGGQMRAIVPNLPNPIRRPGDTVVPVPVPVSPTHRPSLNRNLSGEPQIPIAKVQSPLSFSNEPRVKLVLVWSKERPTLERELTFFDSSSQDPLTLVWTEDRELYQGNGTLNMGQHSGSLLFPTTGEMLPVQPFEVIRKPMGMGMIKLKLHEQYAQREPVKAVDTGGVDRNEQVAKLGLEMKERDRKIEEMKREIEELTEATNTVKSEKQRCKLDLAKQDEQLIVTLLELTKIKTFGREVEANLIDEIDRLKFDMNKLLEPKQLPETHGNAPENVSELNENIRNLEAKETELNQLKDTFAIMSKESNRLTEENENIKAKQVENDMEIQGLLKSITEYKIRDEKLTNELSELKRSNSVVKEGQFDSLMTENSKLQDTNKQLSEDLSKLENERKARIEELMETKSKQQQTLDNNNNKHLNELQEKDKSISKLAKEMETMRTDLGKERDEILKGKELELSNLRQEFARIETELRSEVEEQKKELEFFQTQSSKNEENASFIEVLTSEKSNLEQKIEELREENEKLTLELTENPEKVKLIAELDTANDIIAKLKQSNLANEEQLKIQIHKLENENKQLKDKINTQMEEHNKQITASKQYQQDTEKSKAMIETKDKQISELQTQLTKQQEKEQTYQTQMEKQIKELNEDFEQLKSDNVDLENLVKSDAKNEKFLAVEGEKHVLEEQIDLLRGEIDSLTERKQENKQKIEDLEGSFENLTNQSKDLEIQLGESKSDYQKLHIQREQSQQLIDDLKTELETVKNELRCERENSEMWKQLISKLNSDIEKLAQNDSQLRIADLEKQLAETEGAREETELKLGDMATEIANRDTRIHTLEQDIGILHNKSQVAHSTSTPIMPTNSSKTKEDKKQAKNLKDQGKQKYPDTSGATPGATPSDLTPQIIPVANKSGKSPFKVPYRSGKNVEVVKLKSLPNPSEYQSKQVMCPINKRYELGVLIGIFDLPGKVGFKSVVQRYVGIKLYNPVGSSNGEFRTKRYFECEPNCGIFVPLEDVLIPVI